VTLADVVGRAFGKPLYGAYEIVSYLGAIVFSFSMPYTALRKQHIFVEFIIDKVPRNVGNVMQVATRLLGIALFLWMGWNFVIMSLDMKKANELTQVPVYICNGVLLHHPEFAPFFADKGDYRRSG
jgi:TRAP-type C4-dicarboxylate transport system permease small subunit